MRETTTKPGLRETQPGSGSVSRDRVGPAGGGRRDVALSSSGIDWSGRGCVVGFLRSAVASAVRRSGCFSGPDDDEHRPDWYSAKPNGTGGAGVTDAGECLIRTQWPYSCDQPAAPFVVNIVHTLWNPIAPEIPPPNIENGAQIVVEHSDGSVHVGIPKPQSAHATGGTPKYYDYGNFGHVGER